MHESKQKIALMVWFGWIVSACATSPTKHEILQRKRDEGRPQAAAYAADGFYPEKPAPERGPTPPPERFFFKRCSLTGRHPYPSSTDWQCTDPY